jgi:hypothetical protein
MFYTNTRSPVKPTPIIYAEVSIDAERIEDLDLDLPRPSGA